MSANSRSRKSSTNSRRPHVPSPIPASLRIPSIARRPSNTQLSFVFAQGDSTRPNGKSSEDHLSKQLDGDSGGKQMGLRSRRSSSATIRTVRTSSGLRSDSASVLEQDEEDSQDQGESSERGRTNESPEPIAGPSTSTSPPQHSNNLPIQRNSSPAPTISKRSLNPKTSSTWLRWTSPTPSFPRSPSMNKGKGKEKEKEQAPSLEPSVEAANNSLDTMTPSNQQPATIPLHTPAQNPVLPPPTTKPPDDISSSALSLPAPPNVESAPVNTTRPSSPKSRSWWGRSTPVLQPISTKQVSKSPSVSDGKSTASATDIPQITAHELSHSASFSPETSVTPAVSTTLPSVTSPPSVDSTAIPSKLDPVPSDNTKPTGSAADASGAEIPHQGWRSYLGWRSNGKQVENKEIPPVVDETVTGSEQTKVTQSEELPTTQKPSPTITEMPVEPPTPSAGASEAPAPSQSPSINNIPPHPAPATQPWSSYLYSFVVPPPRQQPTTPPHSTHGHPVEPTDPVEDQKPVHTEPPPPDVNIREATPAPEAVPNPATPPLGAASPTRNAERRPSTTGWLNYLALRASQKKIAGSSIITGESDAKANGEEVMDFSADPEFPSSTPTQQSLAPPQTVRGKDVKVAAESVKSITPKPSQNLEVQKKRLSNASLGSNGSLTPASTSPKARSSIDSTRPGIIQQSGSSLPPPPQAPTVQPNLVIPTFSDTFNRPPRSFLPVPILQETEQPAKGYTAATTGLAWKALGAVGSYVYGGTDGGSRAIHGGIPEEEKESRGRKEGRNVGADLPRRIGLGGGTPDDGWKHVKRVVVVGVHGWFPAKMLNSVIGEPTGTSTKFANMMGQAVQQFFHEKGVDDIRLTLMPLEGEGTIESRVDRLYKAYLSNPAWINDLRRADAIFFAAHSQGCIVTTHLISRMIAQGHIRTPLNHEAVSRCEWAFGPIGVVPSEEPKRGKRGHTHVQGSDGGYQQVAMLAMCGVHLGPLYSISTSTVIQPYLQWFENAAARELFEFQDSTSAVSIAYQKALSMVLENEVRVVLLASLNDQVVPIYGASFSTASHPLLLRALYVDGASYTQSDFMTNLLCFAFMLKNAGIDDQRLVEHLSEATAGSLTGVGHSTPYEELSCYSIAVQYLFHAGPARHPISPLEVEPFSARDAKNDFELPWIMRALVDSPEVKDLFPGELKDLKEGILNWRPNTKVLKEIKKRLEPMAGRQSRLRALHTSPSSASLASNSEQGVGLGVSPGANKALVSGLRKDW